MGSPGHNLLKNNYSFYYIAGELDLELRGIWYVSYGNVQMKCNIWWTKQADWHFKMTFSKALHCD